MCDSITHTSAVKNMEVNNKLYLIAAAAAVQHTLMSYKIIFVKNVHTHTAVLKRV